MSTSTTDGNYFKNVCQSIQKRRREVKREKGNKTRMAIAKLIALNAKAKMFKIENISVCKTSCKCHFHLNIVGYGIKIAD